METTSDEIVTKVNETTAMAPTGEAPEETLVEQILLWRDLKLSGAIFGSVNLICILTLFVKYSFLSVFSFLVMALLVASFLFKNAAKLLEGHLGKDKIPQPSFGLEPFNADAIQAKVPQVVDFLNENITKTRDIVTCKDNKTTLKALGATFGVYLVGRIFPDLVLFYVLFLAAFILPKVYEMNKDEIDKAAAQAQERIAEESAKAYKIAEERTREYSDLASKKFNDTASPYLEKYQPQLDTIRQRFSTTAVTAPADLTDAATSGTKTE
ncbi:hypothetical protein NDN08_004527 [Rhodosorus marinus]|uniref:Reticulon-like protein n=1 Tax=Rhodosorus marinus TaxID=101924 RepID=A0AAV8ULV9_9RHOD|nr:hypothetical protein NDN08_004527 [Rhodosorus marinus]